MTLASWFLSGSSAFAKGGGGGGGHGGGGHHSSGHSFGGYHHGGYRYGGHHYGYSNGYWPGYYGGYRYSSYPGYGYGYHDTGYSYPYYGYGYSDPTYSDAQGYVAQWQVTYATAAPWRMLGIDEVAINDGGVIGMQVTRVYAGSPAERAGLQVDDVIHAANGYLTQQHGNLTWIISGLPSNGTLQMSVRMARDRAEHVINAQIP
jgi:hypothetical protein